MKHILIDHQKDEVRKAYVWIRKNNSTIPDDILNLMKDSAIEKLDKIAKQTDIKMNRIYGDKPTEGNEN